MPRSDVIAHPLWYADIEQILQAKGRWRVAAMALTHRLKELGMLTEWGYRDACVLLSQAGYRRGEPRTPIVPETSQVLGKVFQSLRERGMAAHQVAADLSLTSEELGCYLFGLVPTAIIGEGLGGGVRGALRLVRSRAATGPSSGRSRHLASRLMCGARTLSGDLCRSRVQRVGERCHLHR